MVNYGLVYMHELQAHFHPKWIGFSRLISINIYKNISSVKGGGGGGGGRRRSDEMKNELDVNKIFVASHSIGEQI